MRGRWNRYVIRRWVGTGVKYALVTIFAAIVIGVPVWFVLVNSVKTIGEANALGIGLPSHWNLIQNYSTVIDEGRLPRGLMNTLLIACLSVAGMLFLGALASWIFARTRSRLVGILYYLSVSGILIPPAIVTSIRVLRGLHLYGTYTGIILFYIGVFVPFAIFFITGFIKTIPFELEEAARIDGAGPFAVFMLIIFPLLRPVLMTSFVVLLLFIWNDFFYPFFLLAKSSQWTLTLGLYNFISGYQYEIKWNLVFADVVLVSLPLILVYIFAQRTIVSGIMTGAVHK